MNPKEAKESIQRLQVMEQNVQALGMQKQQFQAQLFEIDGALKELESSPVGYKIIGGIMVSADKPALRAELDGKKEILEVRVQSLEKQEKQLHDKLKKLQEEVLSSVNKE